MASLTRGCGKRKAGGIYAFTGCSDNGFPWQHFLIDPIIHMPQGALDDMGITPVGMTVRQRQTAVGPFTTMYDLWDWIGAAHYPNTADYIEEGIVHGFSAYLPANLDFSKLTKQSRRLMIHPRAYLLNMHEFYANRDFPFCPTEKLNHEDFGIETTDVMCPGLLWETIEGGQAAGSDEKEKRRVRRHTPSVTYYGSCPPEGVTPNYDPGLFMWLHFTLQVIEDVADKTHERALEKLKASGTEIEVELVGE
jgi:hypothetical protein